MRDLPGLVAVSPLGRRTWLARLDDRPGEVVVRAVPEDVGQRVEALLPLWASVLPGPSAPLARLLDVRGDQVGRVVVQERVAGALAGRSAARDRWTAGEVVTLGVPLGQALAAMHDVGLVHGGVTADAVLRSARGMPVLGRLWEAREAEDPGAVLRADGPARSGAALAGRAPTAADDVRALAALCHRLLLGRPPADGAPGELLLAADELGVPRAVAAVVAAALVDDPHERIDAEGFARGLRRAAVAEPLRPTASPRGGVQAPARERTAGEQADREQTARAQTAREEADREQTARKTVAPSLTGRPPRGPGVAQAPGPALSAEGRGARRAVGPWLRVAAVGLALVVAGGVGWVSGQRDSRSGFSALPPVPPPDARTSPAGAPRETAADRRGSPRDVVPSGAEAARWAAVLDSLDAQRAAAFAAGEESRLAAVWAPGVAGLAADRAAIADLRAKQWVVEGLRHRVTDVALTQGSTAQRAWLRVTDVLASHRVVDATGRVIRVVGERRDASYDVEVVRLDGAWRLVAVSRAGSS